MKYIDEFRDPALAGVLAQKIAARVLPGRSYRFMEFCGGHTHAIARYGLVDVLPAPVRMIHGPGCPVCVLPIGRIDMAIELATHFDAILCTYGDMLRVPASGGMSLRIARARGADVRMVYSTLDALHIARDNPGRDVVFFAIGFETTTPATALALQTARREGLRNFGVLCCHVRTPPAIEHLLAAKDDVAIDGFIGPAHVSTVIGSRAYADCADRYRKPVVIAGFEPLDILQAVWMLVGQVNEGRCDVENEFTRAVRPQGNPRALACIEEVFTLRPSFEWRGLGEVPYSAWQMRESYADFDAERRFPVQYHPVPDHKGCDCAAVLRGQKTPSECRLFGKACTPENPVGACMVSSEGACAAHYSYGRHRG
ncbi:hydrogenase formation protein HypD [Candidatus Symbiobacter mobilis]|uniref:Hydrogenase maturation factor n=1 Tax=Candidatus Symbiobacter mobilis CR TaxID=946483 RepID=U5N924_9BURK|nr:hydrogenase formation protein HypD [Candidatus Symbiobacter mobilis]AGX86763.1 hydrogenase maturation protein HypD [Candidatus Symbiobacter mobilis CR]